MAWNPNILGWQPFAPSPDPSQDDPYAALLDPNYGRSQAIGQGLTAAGSALLMGGDPRRPQNFGQALGNGLAAFNQGLGQGQQDAQQRAYLRARGADYASQARDRQAQVAKDADTQRQVDAYIATLPPDQQAMARLAPKEVIAQQLKQMFPDDNAPKTVGGMMWDSKSKSYKPIPGYTEQAQAIAAAGRPPAAPAPPKTIEERDQQILLQGDPGSPEYAMAYTRTFLTPHYVQTNNGVVPIMPAVPPNIRPPAYAGRGGAPTPGGPAATAPQAGTAIPGTAPPMNQDQSNAAGFSDRMTQASAILDQLGAPGKPFVPSQIDSTAGGLPGSNYTTSTQWKQFDQARRNFINAQLRRESGAAISQSEFDNANAQYFPVPNDPPEVLSQKAQNRAQAIANMKRAAGPQYQPAPAGQPQPAPQPSAPPAGATVQWHFENGVLVPGPAGHGASGSW